MGQERDEGETEGAKAGVQSQHCIRDQFLAHGHGLDPVKVWDGSEGLPVCMGVHGGVAGGLMSRRSPYHTATVGQSKHIPKWRHSRSPADNQRRAGAESSACCYLCPVTQGCFSDLAVPGEGLHQAPVWSEPSLFELRHCWGRPAPLGTLNEQMMHSWCVPTVCFGSPSHPSRPHSQCQTFLMWQPMVSGITSRAGAIQVILFLGWAEKLVFILWCPPIWGTCLHSWHVLMAITAARQWTSEAEMQCCSLFCCWRRKLQRKSMSFSSSTTQAAGSGIWHWLWAGPPLLTLFCILDCIKQPPKHSQSSAAWAQW